MAIPEPIPPWYLQPRDQRSLAALTLCALVVVAIFTWLGTRRHGWIEIDSAERFPLNYQVDLNHATWIELSQLPGLGETLASRIIDYRTQHGPFQRVDELLDVSGVGSKTLARIRPHLFVSPPNSEN